MKIIRITENFNTTTVNITNGIIITIPFRFAIPMNTGTTEGTTIKIDIIEASAINTGSITGDRIMTIATIDLIEIVNRSDVSNTNIDTGQH